MSVKGQSLKAKIPMDSPLLRLYIKRGKKVKEAKKRNAGEGPGLGNAGLSPGGVVMVT